MQWELIGIIEAAREMNIQQPHLSSDAKDLIDALQSNMLDSTPPRLADLLSQAMNILSNLGSKSR